MSIFPDIRQKGFFTITTGNPEETHSLARGIGAQLAERTIITLKGDLGSGKTAFVQGLAKGLGVPDDYYVTSPTYNIVNEYPGRLRLYHLDLYRISDPEELYDIGIDEILSNKGVVAVEWPDRLPETLPAPPIEILMHITGSETRSIIVSIP